MFGSGAKRSGLLYILDYLTNSGKRGWLKGLSRRVNLFHDSVATLKSYGGKRYRLCLLKYSRRPGYEFEKYARPQPGTMHDKKLEESIIRARSTIYELVTCNQWDWWITATIDKSKHDRSDLDGFHRTFAQWLRDDSKRSGNKISYLTVPELHSDQVNWHEHGFIRGLPVDELRLFTLEEKLPEYIRKKLIAGEPVYDWPRYRERFGFIDIEPIRSEQAAARYVQKYISKNLERSVKRVGGHLYYCSKGLKRAVEIKRGSLADNETEFDFRNDYVSIRWLDDRDLAVSMIR